MSMTTSEISVKLHGLAKDWTGVVQGKLTINHLHSKEGNHYIWSASCECGGSTLVKSRELGAGDTRSCGCLKKEAMEERNNWFAAKYKTHGMSGTLEHSAWKRVKSRCTNPNNQDYEVYSKLGMDEGFKSDFILFLSDIGMMPDKDNRWSVGRIDNSLGYFKGNIRWEKDLEQAKNKGMYCNNKTGVTGVRKDSQKRPNGSIYELYTATWRDLNQKSRSKGFSISKYGEEFAFLAACAYREQQIDLLNLQGAGYARDHGKAGYNAKGVE